MHIGHTAICRRRSTSATCLVVGVNSDASVRSLNKAPDRPIVPEAQRAEVLAALGCVDYVIIFTEPDPLNLITALQPDVLVKGGDWPVDRIVGREIVEARGGVVKTIPLVPRHVHHVAHSTDPLTIYLSSVEHHLKPINDSVVVSARDGACRYGWTSLSNRLTRLHRRACPHHAPASSVGQAGKSIVADRHRVGRERLNASLMTCTFSMISSAFQRLPSLCSRDGKPCHTRAARPMSV